MTNPFNLPEATPVLSESRYDDCPGEAVFVWAPAGVTRKRCTRQEFVRLQHLVQVENHGFKPADWP